MVSFIAEVSSNHGRNLDRSLAFVDAAADVGCDAVKFQLFRVRELFAPEILAKRPELLERQQWELPISFLPALAERARKRGIQFSCTPFYLDAVDELAPYADFYKVASYELLWTDLIRACAATGKPLILSTGMASLPEIKTAVAVAHDAGATDLTLLHCVSSYPAPLEDTNLAAIASIRDATGTAVGWSDHTRSPAVLERAVHRWGASAVEFHVDLDGTGAEYGPGHCWLFDEIAPVISRVRDGMRADGDGIKEPRASELADREWRADPFDGLRPLRHIRTSWKPK